MAEISAQLVKELREMTGAGLMDCKKALIEADGDLEKAVEILRKSGIAKAAKKLDREAKEGRIEAAVSDDRKKGSMVMLSSETDFVARNEQFIDFARKLVNLALEKEIAEVEKLLEETLDGSLVRDAITNLVATIGENIQLKKLATFTAPEGGLVYTYIHPGNRVGVMIELVAENPEKSTDEKVVNLAKELTMQIAFSKPVAVSESEVPQEVIEKEKKLYEEQAKEEGKPEKAIPKIVEGRLRKFLEENCLLNQPYIRETDMTVAELVEKTSGEVGSLIRITRFVRFEVGAA
ncbi:elongation factor Ts [bacterium]|nr:elongation factor Ts [bacterium]